MTKKQLIEYIQSIPVPDDSLLHVAVDDDIETVKSVGYSTPDEDVTDVFCIHFQLETNAGCDCCGTNDREEGSELCSECNAELCRRDEKNGLVGEHQDIAN